MGYVTFSDLIGLPKTKTAESAKKFFGSIVTRPFSFREDGVGKTKERGVVVKVWWEG